MLGSGLRAKCLWAPGSTAKKGSGLQSVKWWGSGLQSRNFRAQGLQGPPLWDPDLTLLFEPRPFLWSTNPCACQTPLFMQTISSNLYLFPYLDSRAGSLGSLFELGPLLRQLERGVDPRAHQPSPVHEQHMDRRDKKLGAVVVVSIYGINRTNNDVEGWHFRLNRQASGKSQLSFYILVKLLHKEALLT